jgi:hypothetical protein
LFNCLANADFLKIFPEFYARKSFVVVSMASTPFVKQGSMLQYGAVLSTLMSKATLVLLSYLVTVYPIHMCVCMKRKYVTCCIHYFADYVLPFSK